MKDAIGFWVLIVEDEIQKRRYFPVWKGGKSKEQYSFAFLFRGQKKFSDENGKKKFLNIENLFVFKFIN